MTDYVPSAAGSPAAWIRDTILVVPWSIPIWGGFTYVSDWPPHATPGGPTVPTTGQIWPRGNF